MRFLILTHRLARLPLAMLCALVALILSLSACARNAAPVIYVTATPFIAAQGASVAGLPSAAPNVFEPTITPQRATPTPITPTPNPTWPPRNTPASYTVETGDTLAVVAGIYGVDVNNLIKLNPTLNTSSVLQVGQTINVPERPTHVTPNMKLIPDSELVNSPAVRGFDVDRFVRYQPGFLRVYSELVAGRTMSGIEIIQFLALSNSINPRLLLALLEYRGGWITNPVPSAESIDHPLGYKGACIGHAECKGLFLQLSWASDELNAAYYGWKYRGYTTLQFTDNSRLAFSPELNPGSIALQYFLSRTADRTTWANQISSASASGFFATYTALFGDPFRYAVEPLIPPNLEQPALQFPFAHNETWYYTGGPHGGWDGASGWAAIDFAPPKPPDDLIVAQGSCYVSPALTMAMGAGLVVRSGDGAVVINLDGVNDERIGWTVVYLHIADNERIAAGTWVKAGTPIGHPSCQGFDLSAVATHLHIARRYNGEWMPADCWACAPGVPAPPLMLSGWRVRGIPNQIYQGTLENGGQVRRADQGRDLPDNQVIW